MNRSDLTMWQRLPYFYRLFIPCLLLIVSISLLVDYIQSEGAMQSLMTQEQLHLSHRATQIHRTFDALISDIIILSKHKEFDLISEQSSDTQQQHLAPLTEELRQFHLYHPYYSQVRFIGTDGMERIRTNFSHDGIAPVPSSRLQNKSHRAYFTQTMKLGPKQIYISALNLNQEHRKIQQPPQPAVRLSLPVMDSHGHKSGILILNYQARRLLNQIDAGSKHSDTGHTMLLNKTGEWLHNEEKPSLDWGFMYSVRPEHRFSDQFPRAWKQIEQNYSGQFLNQNGLFTFSMVRPTSSLKHRVEISLSDKLVYNTVPNDYHWILISHIPASRLSALLHPSMQLHLFITLLIIITGGLICFSLAQSYQQQERTRHQLAEKDMQMRNIVDSALNGIITINEHGLIETFNPAACRMFGYSDSEIIGRNVSILAAAPHDQMHDHYLKRYIDSGEAHIIGKPRETTGRRKDGSEFPLELFVTARQHQNSWQFIGILHDITRRKAMEEQLTVLATTDSLTGLHNRGFFNEKLREEFRRAQRYQQHPLSLLILDADYFKSVNDQFGHQAGDAVLQAIANTMQESARETDIVARYGGEEFAIILTDTDGSNALSVAERLRLSIEALQIDFEGQIITRTVSIGIASLGDCELEDEDSLLSHADQALYQAKTTGRNRVVLYEHAIAPGPSDNTDL